MFPTDLKLQPQQGLYHLHPSPNVAIFTLWNKFPSVTYRQIRFNMVAQLCADRTKPRRWLGKAVYGTGSLRPHWAHVGMAGPAQRTSHLHPGSQSPEP